MVKILGRMRWTLGHVAFLRISMHYDLLFIENPMVTSFPRTQVYTRHWHSSPDFRVPLPKGKIITMRHVKFISARSVGRHCSSFCAYLPSTKHHDHIFLFPLGEKRNRSCCKALENITGLQKRQNKKQAPNPRVSIACELPTPAGNMQQRQKSRQQITNKNLPPWRLSIHCPLLWASSK